MEYLNFLSANNLGSHVKMKLNTAKACKNATKRIKL